MKTLKYLINNFGSKDLHWQDVSVLWYKQVDCAFSHSVTFVMWGQISLSRATRRLCIEGHAGAVSQLTLPASSKEELKRWVSLSQSPWQHRAQHRLSRHCHLHSETCQRSLEGNLVGVALCQRIWSGTTRSRFRVLSRRDRPEPTPQACSLSTFPEFSALRKVQLILTTSEVSSQTEKLKTRTKSCSIYMPLR